MAVRGQKENASRLSGPHRSTVRGAQLYPLSDFMESFDSDCHPPRTSRSARAPMSDHVQERRFDGYRKGMRLTDAEPTIYMHSDDSDSDTGSGVDDNLPGDYDQLTSGLTPSTSSVSQFY